MLDKSFLHESVWDAIADTPQEAASMKARSKMMMELSEIIKSRKLRQKDAAELFGVTQPRISDLMRGKIHLFSLDMLMDMASSAGMQPEVNVIKPRIKRTVSTRSVGSHHITATALAA
jgi:predicted XRE-type DNA-binding protein